MILKLQVEQLYKLTAQLKAALENAGFKVEKPQYGRTMSVGPLNVSVYAQGGNEFKPAVKWKYGAYPHNTRWKRCVNEKGVWSLPANLVERTKELLEEAEKDDQRRKVDQEAEEKREAAAKKILDESTKVVETLRKDLNLKESPISIYDHHGVTFKPSSSDPAKVQVSFKRKLSPEKVKQLLELLGD